jgi:hypothetical protein
MVEQLKEEGAPGSAITYIEGCFIVFRNTLEEIFLGVDVEGDDDVDTLRIYWKKKYTRVSGMGRLHEGGLG